MSTRLPDSSESPAPPASRTRRLHPALSAALRVALLVVIIMGILRWSAFMESVAFIHPGNTQFATPTRFKDVEFTAADGTRLHAWLMPARRRTPSAGPAPAVLHIHGNQGSIDIHADWSNFLVDRGISVMIFDYRSYGRSQNVGKYLTREQLLLDAQAALDALQARPDVDRSRIGLYGVSLGGSFALALGAQRPEITSICTLGTFSSWPGVASDYVPVLGHLLIRTGMAQSDNAAKLGSRPLLIVHGDRDDIVNVRHAPLIAAAAKAAGVPAELVIVPGAGHLDILDERFDAERRIGDFFERTLRSVESAPTSGAGPSTR